MDRPAWVERIFGRIAIALNDSVFPSVGLLNFIGSGFNVTYNSTLKSVDVDLAAEDFVAHAATGDFGISETTGTTYLSLTALGADQTTTANAAPEVGAKVIVAIDDDSLLSHDVIFDGHGVTVLGPNASGATYRIKASEWGSGSVSGPVITFLYTGSVWKAM